MPGSNFSIINGSDGVSKVSVSTPANDANGNTVVGHLIMTAVSGVATPVDTTHPLTVAATTLPLPAGAATDASLTAMAATLTKISTAVTTPALPTGAATDASLATVAATLTKINTAVASPALPAGAATDASLATVAGTLTKINTAVTTPALPAGAATDASLTAMGATLTKISTAVATPALPAGAATDASLVAMAATLTKINTAVATPALPTGAATDATLASINATLGRIGTTLTALQASEAPFAGVVAMTVDQAQTAQRAVRIICTVAGNVSLTYADGSKDVIPVSVGLSYIAGAITTVNSSGTTATATYANMR